jgi:pimeloyl-ACP methyl ester carboxylesterase
MRGGAAGAPALAVETVTAGQRGSEKSISAVLAHGLLGRGRNMLTFARDLARSLSAQRSNAHVSVHLPDLPNHGASPRFAPSIDESAEQLAGIVSQTKSSLLIGHSLGGKLALYAAGSDWIRQRVEQVWALDCFPGRLTYDLHGTSTTMSQLEQLLDIQGCIHSRHEAKAKMEQLGLSLRLREWVASNLVPDASNSSGSPDGPMRFVFCLEACKQIYESYCNTDLWSVLEGADDKDTERCRFPHPAVHFLRAERTIEHWRAEDEQRLANIARSSNPKAARVHTLENAGHWVHVERPQELRRIILDSQ